MTRYTPDSRDRVRDAVDMVRLVESRVELRKAGVDSFFGCCPFHDERTASFHVRPDEKHYHCFGCSESGDPFDFVMATEGLDFKGALESLADRFGVTLETVDEDPAALARRERRERLYSLLTRTATFYERMFWESREAARARDYMLSERGLAEDVLRTFRVGWAPGGWDKVLLGSRAAEFSDEEMLAAGLIQRSRKDTSRVYDRFRAQVMFPTTDARGRVIGFGGRKLPGDDRDWLGKYINTAEGEVYSKRAVLYGINEARGPAAKVDAMVLAEGYTDVIALHQAGVRHAVGIMGTSLTREQVAELARLVHTLVLCLDADTAGQDAMARAAQLCAEPGLELRVVALPPGADPGEQIRTVGPEALARTVDGSVPYVVFEVQRTLARADLGSPEGKDRAIAALAPVFARVPESVLRDDLIARSAATLRIAEARLVSLLERIGSGGGLAGPPPAGEDIGRPEGSGASAGPDPGPEPPGPAGWDGDPGQEWDGDPGPQWASEPGPPDLPADLPRARPSRPRVVPQVGGAAEIGTRQERSYLVACLSGGEAGRTELARLDPDALLTSPVLRRVVRRLTGQLEIGAAGAETSPGVIAVDVGPGADGDGQVAEVLAELEAEAGRAPKIVGAEEIEHVRLLLELADVGRRREAARVTGTGTLALSQEFHRIRAALSDVIARMSARSDD